jgi:hypothetical protein
VLALLACAVLATVLSACSVSNAATSSHGAAWQVGYRAGQDAVHHHRFRARADWFDVARFCLSTAYRDIQSMKGSALPWTEGFEAGCHRSRHRYHSQLDGIPAKHPHRDNRQHRREAQQDADGR